MTAVKFQEASLGYYLGRWWQDARPLVVCSQREQCGDCRVWGVELLFVECRELRK